MNIILFNDKGQTCFIQIRHIFFFITLYMYIPIFSVIPSVPYLILNIMLILK